MAVHPHPAIKPPDRVILTCGTWRLETRIRGLDIERKTAGCGRMVPHDFVVEREVHSDFAGMIGYEQVWSSRCCGVERRWGYTIEPVVTS